MNRYFDFYDYISVFSFSFHYQLDQLIHCIAYYSNPKSTISLTLDTHDQP